MAELPKEVYLLVGTILGAMVSLLTAMLTTRGQLRLARANQEHQEGYVQDTCKNRSQEHC